MALEHYQSFDFRADTLALINTMNEIIKVYMAQGYTLTVRQLYYQLVARAIVENTERSYKRVTSIANDARLAGLVDWDAIEDRTRNFIRRQRWASGDEILHSAADSFHMDMWEGQESRVFVVVEKEALAGVLERACHAYDVPLLAARGYPSGTVLREFCVEQILPALQGGQRVAVVHLGDHDPSGIDMTRDLEARLAMFSGQGSVVVKRIALTMSQIDDRKPPPNPAKTTDARFAEYRRRFGSKSWELDALPPEYLDQLVRDEIASFVESEQWAARAAEVGETQAEIRKLAKQFGHRRPPSARCGYRSPVG